MKKLNLMRMSGRSMVPIVMICVAIIWVAWIGGCLFPTTTSQEETQVVPTLTTLPATDVGVVEATIYGEWSRTFWIERSNLTYDPDTGYYYDNRYFYFGDAKIILVPPNSLGLSK